MITKNSEEERLADLLFPDVTQTVQDLLKTKWTNSPAFRIAPSPTGFLHIGSLGMALCDYMLAKTFAGKVYIRIEDTDQKREVEGAAELMMKAFENYGITFDNKPIFQSRRVDIYHVFAKDLVVRKLAYPCFCTEQDLQKIRAEQESKKLRTGYYGKYAGCRNLTFEQIQEKIKAGDKWVLRINFSCDDKTQAERITWNDKVKGNMSLPYEVNNAVILKSNGVPPYNLACAVDDTLMGITHVVRGEEWLASTAEHIQLYNALGIEHPNFAHMPVICVTEGESKRKLSKRRDREAVAQNFLDEGYPKDALIEYLLTLYNTDFELWRIANPNKPWREFNFKFEKIGSNSPLFDWNKINDVSKNVIANMTCAQVNTEVKNFFGNKLSTEDLKKIYAVLAVDRGSTRPRKDIAKFSEIITVFDYLFKPVCKSKLIERYEKLWEKNDSKEMWLEKIKAHCVANGIKLRDYTQSIRVALTGREQTTDLYTISQILVKKVY